MPPKSCGQHGTFRQSRTSQHLFGATSVAPFCAHILPGVNDSVNGAREQPTAPSEPLLFKAWTQRQCHETLGGKHNRPATTQDPCSRIPRSRTPPLPHRTTHEEKHHRQKNPPPPPLPPPPPPTSRLTPGGAGGIASPLPGGTPAPPRPSDKRVILAVKTPSHEGTAAPGSAMSTHTGKWIKTRSTGSGRKWCSGSVGRPGNTRKRGMKHEVVEMTALIRLIRHGNL